MIKLCYSLSRGFIFHPSRFSLIRSIACFFFWFDKLDFGDLELLWLKIMHSSSVLSMKCQTTIPIKVWLLFICLSYFYNFSRYASNENVTGICRSPQLEVADFSYNFLVGSIPKCLEFLPRCLF